MPQLPRYPDPPARAAKRRISRNVEVQKQSEPTQKLDPRALRALRRRAAAVRRELRALEAKIARATKAGA